ncbi:MAG: IclR family transcriptional regulator [Thermodesulfobacteriota bacterium]|nr:IclR family transcriptional regulator [Thermodesulfobacteriota bacterium]
MAEKYQAPIVKKAFQILRLISGTDRGLKISELSRNLSISKSTVHGITAALEELGAITRDPLTKRFTLGFTLFELGRSAYSRIDIKDLARPFMQDLMEKTQESVFLGVRNGEHVTIIDIVESMQDLKITSPIGTTIPLMAGATGKIFLSLLGKNQIIQIIESKGLHQYTENTITDPDLYLNEILKVKEKGYAVDNEEYISGVSAVAAPVQVKGHLKSAVWVVGFKASIDEDKLNTLAKQTKNTTELISQKIEQQTSK